MRYVEVPEEWMDEVMSKLDRIQRIVEKPEPAPVLGKVLSARKVADILGVPVQTVYRWARQGKIRSTHVGGRVLFSDVALKEFMEDAR